MAWRPRSSRRQQQPTGDNQADNNGNGYPDAFEAEEAQLLQQINARRKMYMQRMSSAETQYAQKNPAPIEDNSYNAADSTNEADSLKKLFG
jgi:hypothetical protein